MSDAMNLDRRAVLVWAGALAIATGASYHFNLGLSGATPAKAPGYGRDPDMLAPTVPWSRVLTPGQLAAVRVIADHILPREGAHPAASEVGVHHLIDEWVSAPYPEFEVDRELVTGGLHHLDLLARLTGRARDLATADAAIQREVLMRVGDPGSTLPTAPFWKRLRRLILGGYYTTEAGFNDIGYIGNQPLKAFPAPTPEIVAAIDRAAAQLGLIDRIGDRA